MQMVKEEKSYLVGWFVLGAALLLLAFSPSAFAAIYHVDPVAADGGDGSSWGSAFNDIIPALELAAAGDEVRVAEGKIVPGFRLLQPGPDIILTVASVSSEDAGFEDHAAGNLVDSSGLIAGQHGSASDGTMWLTNDGITTASIVFDLGAPIELAAVQIWNFNHAGVFDLTPKGAREVSISTSAAPGQAFVHFADVTLAEATGLDDYAGEELELTGVTAQQVRLEITSNYGDSSQVGLAEVLFKKLTPSLQAPGVTAEVPAGVVVLGGYSGQGGGQRVRDPAQYQTILSGDSLGNDPIEPLTSSTQPSADQVIDNVETVVRLLGDGAVLDGFTIERGIGYSFGFAGEIAAGVAANGACELRSLLIRYNLASRGAGVYVESGAPVLESVIFERNLASAAGAGFYGEVERMTDVSFLGNRAGTGSQGIWGGGAWISGSCTLDRVSFVGNRLNNGASFFKNSGGALTHHRGICTIKNSSFRANTIDGQSPSNASSLASTGAIVLEDVTFGLDRGFGRSHSVVLAPIVTAWRCQFANHETSGSVISMSDGSVIDCLFSGNDSFSILGAGLVERCDIDGSDVSDNGLSFEGTVRNSLIRGHRFHAIRTRGDLRLENVTLVDNAAAAIWVSDGADRVVLVNSIVWGNLSSVDGEGGLSADSSNYIIQDLPGASADPQFAAAWKLGPNSPAIDAGTNEVVGPGDLDADGGVRVIGNSVDLGAYEFGQPASTADIYYSFDGESGGTIQNYGTSYGRGILNTGLANSPIADGSPVSGGAGVMLYCDGTGGSAATHIDTDVLASDMDLLNGADYTMSAWFKAEVLPSGTPPDAMIFGQASGDVLHLGLRTDQLHFGHWNNDSNSGITTVEAGQWYHAAWRYQDGLQSIYLNGVKVSEEARGPLAQDGNILVGTSHFIRNRDFQGWIDEVMIDGRGWTDEELSDLYQQGLALDSDGDGISDVVEANAGGNLDASADSDNDGASTLLEIYSGTDPSDSGSAPALEVEHTGAELIVRHREFINGAVTASGQIEWSSDGVNWWGATSFFNGTTGPYRNFLTQLPASSPVLLYRLRVSPR